MKIENFYSCKKYSSLQGSSGISHAAALAECFWSKKTSEADIAECYQNVAFPFDWVRQKTVRRDAAAINRFMNWLSNMQVAFWGMDYSYTEKGCSYDGKLILARKSDGRMAAIIPLLQTSNRGFGGKSVHTNVATLLQPLCAKFYLENKYPKIQLFVFYLFNSKDDGERLTEVLSTSQKGGNIYTPDYSGFYSNGTFDQDGLKTVINQILSIPVTPSCFTCDRESACKREIAPISDTGSQKSNAAAYQMPKFTEEQALVINHLNGPACVIAGPGGGKTAMLVGRVKRLLERGIHPEFILVVTFTQNAAEELLKRCSSFCETLPTICTIHSLCYRILKNNEDYVGKLTVLTDAKRMEIIENLLSVFPQDGFSCERGYGKDGLFKTVYRRVVEFRQSLSKEAFLQKHPELNNNFFLLAEQYDCIVKALGLITFDEMIVRTNQLFAEHPEILSMYQSIFKYVMVDEFQDVDSQQVHFLYSVAAHGNLVVVGDDDQGIYGFRGGNGKYMLEFNKAFPSAKYVTLSQNFRSTAAIVSASAKLIGHNRVRFDKNIKASRCSGIAPIVISGKDAASVTLIVQECLKKGYSYGDIAVLSTKNKPLEDLHAHVAFPTILAKAYIRNTRLFLCVINTMRLEKDPFNEYACSELAQLGVLHLKDSLIALCSAIPTISSFVQEIALVCHMESEVPGMLRFIEQSQIHNKEMLFSHMTYMERFEDETRAELPVQNKVFLITVHESKGKEFPVVIMLDDYMEATEETRRLYYVAMTRAKDLVYIMRDKNCETNFTSEFNHTEFQKIG